MLCRKSRIRREFLRGMRLFPVLYAASAPKASWPHRRCYLLVRASTPGSFLPSKNSREAPPPVLM